MPSSVRNMLGREIEGEVVAGERLLSPMLAPLPDPASLSSAFSALDILVLTACTSAGMPSRQSHTATHTSAPFYDTERVSSKRHYRAALPLAPPEAPRPRGSRPGTRLSQLRPA
jgi:hypothetical protein